jgi:hypothetical protein
MKKLCIVTPHHTNQLSLVAELGLRRCAETLGLKYDWFLVMPSRCDPKPILDITPLPTILPFPDDLFTSKRSAQLLYMSPDFFEKFKDYEYILLCELDAYIFHDRVEPFIQGDYDYIGAPWLDKEWLKLSSHWYAKLPLHWVFREQVGNGGLSLWRVEVFLKASRQLQPLIRRIRWLSHDIFWSQIASKLGVRIRRPTANVAARFAVETQPKKCFLLNGGELPLGVHGWDRYDWDFWREKIPGVEAIYEDLASKGVKPL